MSPSHDTVKKRRFYIVASVIAVIVILALLLVRSSRPVPTAREGQSAARARPDSRAEPTPEPVAAKPAPGPAPSTPSPPSAPPTAKQVANEYRELTRIKDRAQKLAAAESFIAKHRNAANPSIAENVVAAMQLKAGLAPSDARLAVYDEILARHPSTDGLKDSFIARLGKVKLDKARLVKDRAEKIRLAEQAVTENETSEFPDRRIVFGNANNFLATLVKDDKDKNSYYDKVVAIPLVGKSPPALMTVVATAMNGKALLADPEAKVRWLSYIVRNFDGRKHSGLDYQVLVAKLEWAKMMPRDDALRAYDLIIGQYGDAASQATKKQVEQAAREKRLLEERK